MMINLACSNIFSGMDLYIKFKKIGWNHIVSCSAVLRGISEVSKSPEIIFVIGIRIITDFSEEQNFQAAIIDNKTCSHCDTSKLTLEWSVKIPMMSLKSFLLVYNLEGQSTFKNCRSLVFVHALHDVYLPADVPTRMPPLDIFLPSSLTSQFSASHSHTFPCKAFLQPLWYWKNRNLCRFVGRTELPGPHNIQQNLFPLWHQ